MIELIYKVAWNNQVDNFDKEFQGSRFHPWHHACIVLLILIVG